MSQSTVWWLTQARLPTRLAALSLLLFAVNLTTDPSAIPWPGQEPGSHLVHTITFGVVVVLTALPAGAVWLLERAVRGPRPGRALPWLWANAVLSLCGPPLGTVIGLMMLGALVDRPTRAALRAGTDVA